MNNTTVQANADVNPRGQKRPKNGQGRGIGRPGGLRMGRNINACPKGGPGYGEGNGRGLGRNRV